MSQTSIDAGSPDLPTLVAHRLTELRRAAGLTQEQLAAKLDVGTKYYQRIECGRENLTLRSLARLAVVLGVPAFELLRPSAPRVRRPGRPRRT
jgi:transcriptional regulator with XRE-family HTH domain